LKPLTLLLFIFSCCTLIAQQPDSNHDSLLLEYKKQNKLTAYANLAHDVSYSYAIQGDFITAVKYALEEVEHKKHLPIKKQKNSLFNLGLFFFKTKEYSKSIDAYNKVIDSFEIDQKTYRAYCENARNYDKLGDYFQAVNHYEKGLAKPEKIATRRLPGLYLNNIILNHKINSKKSIEENKELLKKVDSLGLITSLSETNLNSLYNEYGLFYKNEENYNFNKSRYYYLKNYNKAIKDKNPKMIVNASNQLSVLYEKEKKDSALFYINTGIKYAKGNEDLPQLYRNKADYYFSKKQTNEALKTIQYALQSTLRVQIDSAISFSPSLKTLVTSKNKIISLFVLKNKAKYIIDSNEFSADSKLYQVALESIYLANKLLDIVRKESSESQTRLFWQEEASEIFMLGVKACFKLNKPEEALYFIEKNKALLLLENIAENKLRTNSNIPATILQREQDFKNRIYASENELNNNSAKAPKEEFHSLKIEYSKFIESLKDTYPEYYNSKQPVTVEAIESIKNSLDENTTILEYILNEDEGFLLAISKNSTRLFQLSETHNLEVEINKYLKLIRQPLTTTEELENHKKLANALYTRLLPFDNDDILKKKLLIIPDYTLQNLPFESLKKDTQYLVEDFEISYAYSLSFLNSNKKLARNTNNTFLGFAPKTFNYDNLQVLSRSDKEVQIIKEQLNGDILLDTAATKTNFFSKIKAYKIIHLSTHADANDSISPWIAFKNKKLYLNELYTAKNQAELVVLNACNSSLGRINTGEGVFSLARGFFHSGANSVISSLWNVNDKSNSEITTSFYRYLKDGKTKSASLRQAKLEYLKTHSLSEASPYYWSSLILIGDDSAIKFESNLLYYLALAFFILLFLFFVAKKNKNLG